MIGETLLAREGVWQVPVLLGIVHTPQLRADGSLLTTPGYDPQTQLLFKPDGEVFPEIPDRPSKEDAARALEVVKQVDHPRFPSPVRLIVSVALSLLLTGVCRRDARLCPLTRNNRTDGRDRQVAIDRSDLDPAVGTTGAGAFRPRSTTPNSRSGSAPR